MKSTPYLLVLYGSLALSASATLLFAASPDGSSDYTIVERGPHHRVWQRVVQTDDGTTQTNAFTELQTGLHYWFSGDWAESRAEIVVTPDGAQAMQGQHQAHFGVNANAAGVIALTLPDGQVQSSHVLGLNYYDAEANQTVWVALLTNSPGQLFPPNQVLYPGALRGQAVCDLRYTYTKAGLEQDVIIRTALPDPTLLGLNPASTWVQAVSEFVSGPEPVVLSRTVIAGQVEDQEIQVGVMRFWKGKAFALGQEEPQATVARRWEVTEGRRLLVEAVRWTQIADAVSQLPKLSANESRPAKMAALLPGAPKKNSTAKPMMLADAGMGTRPGFVLDYSQVSSSTNFTFKGDTTWYVSGTINLSSTTTIEGGCIIKFTNTSSAKISVTGTIDCQTGPYRPAVFTHYLDNTVGETIATGTITNNYGTALEIDTTTNVLHDLRFSYASSAVALGFEFGQINVANAQFVQCKYAIDSSGSDQNTNLVDNCLFYSVTDVLKGGYAEVLRAQHLTVDYCSRILEAHSGSGNGDLYLTNCLLVAVTNRWGKYASLTTNSTAYFTNDPGGIFQSVGAASHYLADGSTYRDAGTTNISAGLLAGLQQRTTYPPVEIATNITGDTTLSPQPIRDTDTPDLGYHYDPLDYVVSGITLTNATLLLTNGVALGTYGASTSYGISIKSGYLISEGLATNLNRIVRYNTVQEQATTNWSSSTVAPSIKSGHPTTITPVQLRFTECSMLAAQGDHFDGDHYEDVTPFCFQEFGLASIWWTSVG